MATLIPQLRFKGPNSGTVLCLIAGGTINDLQDTYTDSTGGTPNQNPVELDSNGYADIWLGSGNYKFIIYDSLGAIWKTIDNVVSAGSFAASLAASSGSSLIGYLSYETGATARTVEERLNDEVRVNDFVTGGDGTSGNPWTGWDTAITWAPRTTYYFNDGHYAYATSPNFALDHLKLAASHATVIHHTGSGYAMKFDAGATSGDAVGIDVCIRLEGNASSTGGVLQRGCTRSKFDMSFRNMPGTCFQEDTGVLNLYYLEHTAYVYGESIQPDRLITVSRRAAGQESSANIYYLRAENCTNPGINLSFSLNSTFIGWTSEANGGGIYIETTSAYNTFIGLDFESNSGLDIECRGNSNTFINCLSTGTVQIQGINNSLIGGTYNTIRAWGNKNNFGPLLYSNNGGTFDVSGGTNYTKRGCYNATAATWDLDVLQPVAEFRTGGGSVTAANGVATTLFATTGTGLWQVYCYVNSGDAANFTASATVLQESGGSARITSNNGGALTLTLSGSNIQATQTSGLSKTIVYAYHRIN